MSKLTHADKEDNWEWDKAQDIKFYYQKISCLVVSYRASPKIEI